jgi:ribosomal protein S18 acetylase RimI-like enzyme
MAVAWIGRACRDDSREAGDAVIDLCMTRDLRREAAPPTAPDGYSLRWYRPGDRDLWQAIQESTGIYDPVPPDLFEREFGEAQELLPKRQCFLLDSDGRAVGTSTAWIATPDRGAGEGRVHWVAVVPERQRRGLGGFLAETACRRLRELGAGTAYLTTGSENLAAVQLYLGLGFRPEVRGAEELEAWRALRGALESRFEKALEGLAV